MKNYTLQALDHNAFFAAGCPLCGYKAQYPLIFYLAELGEDSAHDGGIFAMSGLFLLSGRQVAQISPFFLLSYDVPRVDDGRVISGIIYVAKHGLQLRGPATTFTAQSNKPEYSAVGRWVSSRPSLTIETKAPVRMISGLPLTPGPKSTRSIKSRKASSTLLLLPLLALSSSCCVAMGALGIEIGCQRL